MNMAADVTSHNLQNTSKCIMKYFSVLMFLHVVDLIDGHDGYKVFFSSNTNEYSQVKVAFTKPIPNWIRGVLVSS